MISSERIPNNVDLGGNKRLQRALEHWQPKYLEWWRDMGPEGFQDHHQVYLRTAISVDPDGWAHFEFRETARLPLGHLPGRPGVRSDDRLRQLVRPAGLARGPRRVPEPAAPSDRDPGRYRAGVGRAAAPARSQVSQPVRPAQPVPGQRRGRAGTSGRWSTCCTLTSAATDATRRRSCCPGRAATGTSLASWRPSMSRSRTGSTSSCSRCSPIVTASRSSCRWRRARSIRWPGPPDSC